MILLDQERLADERWRVKLSDYGSVNFVQNLMVTTKAPGYMAQDTPESLNPAMWSPKMDVSSRYGVLMIERRGLQFDCQCSVN